MKILIAGIPGTGKTSTGRYLQNHYGFHHLEVEDLPEGGGKRRCEAVRNFLCGKKKIVLTWGFYPGKNQIQEIEELMETGFSLIWFDGNREAALKFFLKKGLRPEEDFHAQIARLDASRMIHRLFPAVLNSFDSTGKFLSRAVIAQAVQALALAEKRRMKRETIMDVRKVLCLTEYGSL